MTVSQNTFHFSICNPIARRYHSHMNTHPAIEISGLTKTYAKSKKAAAKTALKGVDLVVPRGSIFGLLGPNGAGKSTMINILAGLVNKSAGSAKICGFDIETQTRQARSSIGIVPQEITMDVFFTPHQALELQAGYYGVPKSCLLYTSPSPRD